MEWFFFEEFEKLFDELGNFVSFLGELFNYLPSWISVIFSSILIVLILAGGLKLAFKLIG